MKKEFLIIFFGRLTIALVGLAALRLMTHYLEPEQYGELALLNSIQVSCGLILVNPVGQFINVNTHAWSDDDSLLDRMRSYQGYLMIVGLIGSVVVLISMFNTSTDIVLSMLVIAITVFGINLNNTLVPLLNMLGHRKASILWGLTSVILGTVLSTLFVLLVAPTAISWLIGQGLGMLLGGLGARHHLYRVSESKQTSHSVSWINRHNLYSFCAPLVVATFLMWVSQSGYRFLIEYYWGLESLAFFAVGWSVAGAVWAVVEAVASQFLYPYFFRGASSDDVEQVKSAYSDLVNVLIPVYVLIAGAMVLSAPYILKVLVDAQYQSALLFLIIGVIVELLRLSAGVFSLAAHVTHNTQKLTLPYSLGALLIVAPIIIAGMFSVDLIFVGYVLIIAGFVILAVMALRMNSLLKIRINWPTWSLAIVISLLMMLFAEMEGNINWLSTFTHLAIIGFVTSLLIFIMLRNNSSFLRLINIPIKLL